VAEALGVAATDLHALGVIPAVVPEPHGGAHRDPAGAVRLLEPELRRALAEAMRGRGSARRSRREARVRRMGSTSSNAFRQAAGMLGGASEVAVHALGAGVQAIGARILRRGGGADGEADGTEAISAG
jgi:hypothetical protein